nr:DNA-directed RNA polymerase V subunit 1 [Tanacetum cinerariifolium]
QERSLDFESLSFEASFLDCFRKFPVDPAFAADSQSCVDIARIADGACYLEFKVPSRSRRDGSCDFLDRYGWYDLMVVVVKVKAEEEEEGDLITSLEQDTQKGHQENQLKLPKLEVVKAEAACQKKLNSATKAEANGNDGHKCIYIEIKKRPKLKHSVSNLAK